VLNFRKRHAEAMRALGFMVSATAAGTACVFVPWQIALDQRINREIAAPEINREFLNISIQRLHMARQTFCAFTNPIERAANERVVDDLLYTGEWVIAPDQADCETRLTDDLLPHQTYLCTSDEADLDDLTPVVTSIVAGLRSTCGKVQTCEGEKNDQS
jgi:hypothetical protein